MFLVRFTTTILRSLASITFLEISHENLTHNIHVSNVPDLN